jgi:hypothetical protein
MSEYFKRFIILSVFIQIRQVRHQSVDKMKYYQPHFSQDMVLGLGLDRGVPIQNSKTLGQFFEPLYMVHYLYRLGSVHGPSN